MGESVKHYITEWRMQLARDELLTSPQTQAVLAEKYGYQSEAAFSRAFKRVFGVPPGAVRKEIHAASEAGQSAATASSGLLAS